MGVQIFVLLRNVPMGSNISYKQFSKMSAGLCKSGGAVVDCLSSCLLEWWHQPGMNGPISECNMVVVEVLVVAR